MNDKSKKQLKSKRENFTINIDFNPNFKLLSWGTLTILILSLIGQFCCMIFIKDNIIWRNDLIDCLKEITKYTGTFIAGLLAGKLIK